MLEEAVSVFAAFSKAGDGRASPEQPCAQRISHCKKTILTSLTRSRWETAAVSEALSWWVTRVIHNERF